MRGKSLMVMGTASSVGKSVLCSAFLRIMKQDGYKVAPFKAQNMALNSFVTKDGLEMGRAQVTQAQAAGVEPDVRMNPVLLKPTSDRRSQVIVDGKAIGTMTAMEYHRYKPALRERIKATYDALESTVDCVVIEGAGSPAEINLRAGDIVNMSMAESADAAGGRHQLGRRVRVAAGHRDAADGRGTRPREGRHHQQIPWRCEDS